MPKSDPLSLRDMEQSEFMEQAKRWMPLVTSQNDTPTRSCPFYLS